MKTLALRLAVSLFGMALPPLAAAQNLAVPGRLDLNGRWELTEYGQRRDNGNAIVEIEHSGPGVFAKFITGAECFNGQARPDFFLAELTVVHPTTPPTAQLSSPAMWVCSNDPDLVKKCGGSGAVKASYKTTFKDAVVDPDFIEGTRVTQGVKGCSLDSGENGTAPFSLRRLVPCEFEEVMVKQRDNELLDIRLNTFIPAFAAFVTAADAAQRRFSDMYRGMPTSTLRYPQEKLRVATNDTEGTEALAAALPDIVHNAGMGGGASDGGRYGMAGRAAAHGGPADDRADHRG